MILSKALNRCNIWVLFGLTVFIVCAAFISTDASGQVKGDEKAPPAVIDNIAAGRPQDLIVLFDDTDIANEAASMREGLGITYDNEAILEVKAAMYESLKGDVISALPAGEFEILRDYSHLPMMFLRIKTLNSLTRLLERLEVKRVYLDGVNRPFLSESLPLINQPPVEAAGKVGTGTTVSVIDTGVDYTRSAFGPCTSPNTPAGCKVVYAQDFAPDDGSLDDSGHGTNVAGIVLGVAPDTRIAALDVFEYIAGCGNCAYTSVIISAINWSITNQATYNIVAMNLSLGGSTKYTATCPTSVYATPINNAKSAGILAAIASGNSGWPDGISSPACVPNAVSVGAVYDSNVGPKFWSVCTDLTTAADQVTCFSNSASFLTILAPGSVINAADLAYSGTSQATPHVAGAAAVLKGAGAFPAETVDQTVTRMTSTGVPVTDPKNGLTHPRLDLQAAAAGGGTYSISGTVTTGGGFGGGGSSPLSGVTMTLSGDATGTTTTDGSGNYTFTGLADGSYTVTPGKGGYTFTPTSRSVTISGANVTGRNFTGTYTGAPTYSISGTVTSGASPLSGVTMTLSGAATGTTTTDASGNYTFTGLADGSYTVTPGMGGYTFTPTSRNVTISGADVTGQDFTGTATGGTYSISGTVTTGGGFGGGGSSPLSGVTMSLSGDATGTTTTDGSGNYTFTGLADGSYTVTPGKGGYTFTPTSRSVTISGANVTGRNFTGTYTGAPTYSISGTVTSGGSPLSGVTMTLSGAATGTTTTDASGNYTFTGLADGSYTVTPGMGGYTFTPTSRSVTISGANVTGQDFTGTPTGGGTYSISGTVTTPGMGSAGGGPLSGVSMTLSGDATGTTTTDGSGNYTFTGLADGSYTVTPGKGGYTFTPTSRSVTISGANVTGRNFTGTQ